MPSLQKPERIFFIGATLYQDLVQRSYIERIYPYAKVSKITYRYPSYTPEVVKDLQNVILSCHTLIAVFILDKYYERLCKDLEAQNFKAIHKENNTLYEYEGSHLIIKPIKLFSKIESNIKFSNKNVAAFKLFGTKEALLELEDRLQEHAIIVKVLPTWYNIEIQDNEGERILTRSVEELNIKMLAISSVRESLITYLAAKNKTIAFAESCTGGLLASKLTEKSGASKVLKGSMVTYSNDIKHEWLGVENEVFEKYGAVSSECVSQMLDGIQKQTNCDIAVAISGIAGPTGGTEEKPVGTVYIGVKNGDKKIIKKFFFDGDRINIQEQSARSALEMILYSEENFFTFF